MANVNLASRYYADPGIYARERETIFRASWQLLGSAQSLARVGDYLATEIAGYGVIIVRGADGRLRGFDNVCRHRGSRLVDDGSGRCEQLRCPYHGWLYDLDGRLAATPFYDEPSPFAREDWPLAPVSVEEWRGLVFAALAPRDGFEAETGDFATEIRDVPLERYQKLISQDFVIDVNWKAYLDQFLETYHVPVVHGVDTSARMDEYTVEPLRHIMRMTPPEGVFYGLKWLWVWPNWTISLIPGGMKTSRIDPIDAGHCRAHLDYYFADGSAAGESARRKVADTTASIFAEDVRAVRRVQLNHIAGTHTSGPYHPKHERVVAYFHELIRKALGPL